MDYLLDSDIINIMYDDQRKEEHNIIHTRLSQLTDEDRLLTSVLVIYEMEYSYFNAPENKKTAIRNTINSIIDDFDALLPINQSAAPIFGELKAKLKTKKNLSRKEMRKHNVDLMLASTAIDTSSVLVCNDDIYREISDLNENLIFQNWLNN